MCDPEFHRPWWKFYALKWRGRQANRALQGGDNLFGLGQGKRRCAGSNGDLPGHAMRTPEMPPMAAANRYCLADSLAPIYKASYARWPACCTMGEKGEIIVGNTDYRFGS